jgi:Plasmid pRiA4b ORF-3-like protein
MSNVPRIPGSRHSVAPVKTSRLRISLRDVHPPVLRVIDVPADSTLPELHELLQAGLGWTNSHLHQFVAGDQLYGVPDEEWEAQHDESGVRLGQLPRRFGYLYDFGDGWEHDVEVLGPGGDQPGCVFGEGACPPEDCGGPYGYAELLKVLADPTHPEHASLRDWAGELRDFDQAATDTLVRHVVGAVPEAVRLFLDLAKTGVKLTPRGRLPRSFVQQVQLARPGWSFSDRPARVADDLLPLADLHGVLRRVRLVRLSNGILKPTRAADDDLQIVRRLRSWFPPHEFVSVLTGVSVAILLNSPPMSLDDLGARVHPLLGYGWQRGGRPVTVSDVRSSLGALIGVLEGLDLVQIDWPIWHPGPSARTLLPSATMLGEFWSRRAPIDATR